MTSGHDLRAVSSSSHFGTLVGRVLAHSRGRESIFLGKTLPPTGSAAIQAECCHVDSDTILSMGEHYSHIICPLTVCHTIQLSHIEAIGLVIQQLESDGETNGTRDPQSQFTSPAAD